MKELKKKRDEIIHPKKVEHIHEASLSEFHRLKHVFKDYNTFINKLMDDFFLSIEIKLGNNLKIN